MVEILLDFIRAERDRNWTLHLEAFAAMLPWLTIYDHTNYARWGPVYLADMKLEKTGPEVHSEFVSRNFVVKRTNRRFDQVPADQATEWMNRMCKMQSRMASLPLQGMIKPDLQVWRYLVRTIAHLTGHKVTSKPGR